MADVAMVYTLYSYIGRGGYGVELEKEDGHFLSKKGIFVLKCEIVKEKGSARMP